MATRPQLPLRGCHHLRRISILRSQKEEAIQPGDQHINLCDVRIKKPRCNRCAKRFAGVLLPCEPGVNDSLRLGKQAEPPICRGNRRNTGLHVAEERGFLRNEESEEVFQNSIGLVIRHDPNAHSWQQRLRGRINNRTVRRRVCRNVLVPHVDESVSQRLPACLHVGIGINHHADNVAIFTRLEPYREAFQEHGDAAVRLHLIKTGNPAISADVLENMLVIEDLPPGESSGLPCQRTSIRSRVATANSSSRNSVGMMSSPLRERRTSTPSSGIFGGCLLKRVDGVPTMGRGKDLDIQLLGETEHGPPSIQLNRVVHPVLELVDEKEYHPWH